MGIIGIKGTLRFYWRRMMYACKSLVDIIWNWYIDSFLIMIPFQLNSTENFTIPINSDIVVFLMCLLDGHHCDFQQFWIQSCQQQDWMFLVVWGVVVWVFPKGRTNHRWESGIYIHWYNRHLSESIIHLAWNISNFGIRVSGYIVKKLIDLGFDILTWDVQKGVDDAIMSAYMVFSIDWE